MFVGLNRSRHTFRFNSPKILLFSPETFRIKPSLTFFFTFLPFILMYSSILPKIYSVWYFSNVYPVFYLVSLHEIPKFHQIFCCGILWKGTVSRKFRAIRPKLCGNCSFSKNFHTGNLGEISVFYAVYSILWVEKHCAEYARIRVFSDPSRISSILSLYEKIRARTNPYSGIFYSVHLLQDTGK